MKKLQTNIYRIDYTDVLSDNNGKYIIIEDYLDISITIKNKLTQIPLIEFIQNTNNVSNLEPSIPLGYEYKKIYLTTNPEETINLDNYKLIINDKRNININKNISDYPSLLSLYNLFYQNINLYTQTVNYREQNEKQNDKISQIQDNSINQIKIANNIAYDNDNPLDQNIYFYLPKQNNFLQKFFIKLQSNKLKNRPPRALQLQLLDDKNNILLQLKNNIRSFNFDNIYNSSSSNNEIYYDEEYGHKYGVLYNENNNQTIAASVWSNEFEYNSDAYVIEWYLTVEQVNTIFEYMKNKSTAYFSFKMRYASEKDDNNNYIWRGWSKIIKPIYINNPPPPPTELQMLI